MNVAFEDRVWKTIDKIVVPDFVKFISDINRNGDRKVHIGTDGQKYGKHLDFVTCVAVLNPGKGGRVFYTKSREKNTGSLQHKLFSEVGLSIETALALCEVIPAEDILVHVDANTNMKWDSAKYHKQLAGMVAGFGFNSVLKPDAWAASHAADHVVNHRNENISARKKSRKKAKRSGNRK